MLPFLYFCFFFFSFLFLFLWRCILLYYRQKVKQTIWTFWSSETQGQSVGPGEKAQWTFSSTGGRAPGYRLSPDHFQTVKQILAPDWAQNGFVSLCPILEQHLLSFFVISYMTAIDSIMACLAHAPKKCTHSGNFYFDINSPFQNTVYPKLKTLFRKYKLELTMGIHACIDHIFVNIREFKMPQQLTATKTSHENIFSVSIVIIPTRLLC